MGSLSESKITDREATLNELGGEGWEAVAVIEQTDGWCVLLKMPQIATY
jgi:hypothetical protein